MTLMMAGRVDLETLLWEAREIMRDLSKVSRAQSAEIERLGGCPWEGARELQERAESAVASVEAALHQVEIAENFAAFDDEAASEASSTYADRHAAIEQWAAQTTRLREEFDGKDFFPLGTDGHADLAVDEVHHNEHEEDEYTGDQLGDISFASASSSFWRADNFNWADEPSSDLDGDTDGDEFDTSGSLLNVPELLDDSARFDSASDSGESFFSSDMLAHSGVDSDAAETVCSQRELEDLIVAQPVANTPVNRRIIRDRTVSFNVKMLDELDEDTPEPDTPPKSSTSAYPSRPLYHKSVPHMRRLARKGSLPNINRLVTLQE